MREREVFGLYLFDFDILLCLSKFKATTHLKEVRQPLCLEQQLSLDLCL